MALRCKILGHKRVVLSRYDFKGMHVTAARCSRCKDDMSTRAPIDLMNRQSPPDTIEGFRGK